MTLSEPAQQIISNSKGYTLQQIIGESQFACLSSQAMLFRLGSELHFMQFRVEEEVMRLRSFESIRIEGMIHSCLMEEQGKFVALTREKLLLVEYKAGRVVQRTLMEAPRVEGSALPYLKVAALQKNTLFLLTQQHRLEMYSVEADTRLRLSGSTELQLSREGCDMAISTLMIEKRKDANKYAVLTVCSYSSAGKFEKECLYILEVELAEGKLSSTPFEVLSVLARGDLQVRSFMVHSQNSKEFLEMCLNNQILVVYRFINRYMVWEGIYHKKIKEDAQTRSFGLLRYNLFYVVEKFLLELYQFSFAEDKKTDKTVIKVELAQFTPDENGGVRPSLGYSLFVQEGLLGSVLLNCTVEPTKIALYFRCSVKCDVSRKLDQMVALIQQHKELEPELDKATAFMAAKMQVNQQEIQKEVWLRWPRVLQKNSHSIRKLIEVGEPHYIEKQLAELLRKSRLKLDLVEDILVKCEHMYRKQLGKEFTWQWLRRFVKCNFKVKKIKLHMLTCHSKEISFEEWNHLKHNDMDRELKSYFPEFRKVDLELALGLFPHYFFCSYYQNLCHAFGLIKDVVYFVSNFNFLFPSKNRMDIWELNLDRREHQLTCEKLQKIYAQSKKKQGPFEGMYQEAKKGNPKYMVNNDVFTTQQPLASFEQAYNLFFCALVESYPAVTLQLSQKVLTILSESNSMPEVTRLHLSCVLDMYFAIEGFTQSLKLKEMLELSPQKLFERLLELQLYELLIKVVKPVYEVLEQHGLSESFEKYLNRYMCQKTVFNKHFTQILKVSRQLPQEELESILQSLLDCMYFSMGISNAGDAQAYIEEYFFIKVKSDILRQKILRLESILAHQESFIGLDPALKLIDIEMGEEVFHRMAEHFLLTNAQPIESGKLPLQEFQKFIKEMQFLREELYKDFTDQALFRRLLKEAFERLKVWKHFVGWLMGSEFPPLPQQRKQQLLNDMVERHKMEAYKSSSIVTTNELMHRLIQQYENENFSRVERERLQFISLFQQFGLEAKVTEAADLSQPKIFEGFQSFINSESFLKSESEHKTAFIELLYDLSRKGNSRTKVEKLRIRELEQACETALENSDYQSFLECLQEHLTRSSFQDFDADFKILWVRFIGQLVHEVFWNDLGLFILRKCLYLIPDFKDSMNQFFAFLTKDNQSLFQQNPVEYLKLRTGYLKKKGRAWTNRRIEVIEGRVKKSLSSKNILEFMFRHLLISDHRLAFAFIKAVLKHVQLQNVYKICIICLESEYFVGKLDIIRLLIETICLQFTREYEKDVRGSGTNESELLVLILKLKPNAKDEESRNKLNFFESILSNCLRLRTYYEKLGEEQSMSDPVFSMEMSGGPHVQMETILQSLLCFNESVIPMLRGGSSHQHDPNQIMPPLQIGEELVDSDQGQP